MASQDTAQWSALTLTYRQIWNQRVDLPFLLLKGEELYILETQKKDD